MSEQSPEPAEATDVDAADLDVDRDVDPPPTSDRAVYLDEGDALGGTGGLDAGGAG